MAIKEIKREWQPCQLAYVKHFLLHTEEDLKNMPRCSVGSRATVSETDNEYVKTADGWMLLCDCDEDGGQGAGGSGGVQPDWDQSDPNAADYVKNRPCYREVNRKHFNEVFGTNVFPCTVATQDEGWAIVGDLPGIVPLVEGFTYEVLFNGNTYTCEVIIDPDAGRYIGGDYNSDTEEINFAQYPFAILDGMLWTENPGEYSLDVNVVERKTVVNYGPTVTFATAKDASGNPYLSAEDAEAIAKAWNNGIPVRVAVSDGSLGFVTNVFDVTTSFIYASGPDTYYGGTVLFGFRRTDGSLRMSNSVRVGNINEGGNSFPKLFINNRWYKIAVASDGTLKATEA